MKQTVETLSEPEAARICELFDTLTPRVLPGEWRVGEQFANAGWWHSRDGLKVCVEVEMHEGSLWVHLSCSRRDRIPNWHDLRRVKDLFIGRDRKAIQVLPPEAEYVNIHPHVLHLWASLEGDPLPDFRHPDGGI